MVWLMAKYCLCLRYVVLFTKSCSFLKHTIKYLLITLPNWMLLLSFKHLMQKFFYLNKERNCATLIFPRQQWGSLGEVKLSLTNWQKAPQNSLQIFRTFCCLLTQCLMFCYSTLFCILLHYICMPFFISLSVYMWSSIYLCWQNVSIRWCLQ